MCPDDTDELLDRISQGDPVAASKLLMRHRPRLRRMVQLRYDPRLAARLDPSDVVQEAMTAAYQRLDRYVAERPLAFYPWLRAIAWEKLVEMHRRHIAAQRRSVEREVNPPRLGADSEKVLTERMIQVQLTPSQALVQAEFRDRVRDAIKRLPAHDREVIVLSHLEELTFPEIAAVLGVGEQAVYSRYRRALQRLHRFLNNE